MSKLFLPTGYVVSELANYWKKFSSIVHHHKYANNYEYQKAILMINRLPFVDTGFSIWVENEKLHSPIAVLHYEFYSSLDELALKIEANKNSIQCLTSAKGWYANSIPFGQAQFPQLYDYADQVDTLQFLQFNEVLKPT